MRMRLRGGVVSLVDSNRCAPKMGQSESSFKRNYEDSVSQLSSVQLREITTHFNEVYAKAGGSKGHLVDREAFSKYFKLPVTVGERLFEAFDAHKNGKISCEEFVCGLAVLLHGSFSSKCRLLFQVFNIHGDEGISREELATMLHAILQSTNTIVMAVSRVEGGGVRGGSAVMEGENREQAIRSMVDSAFRNCDITGTGKLLPLEFEYWVRRNPKILDTLLSFQPQETHGTLGPLLLSSEGDDTSESTVSVPLHPSPIPSRSLQPPTGSQGSLEVTHSPIRPIRSEPVLTTMEMNKTTPQGISSDVKTHMSTSSVAIEMGASSPTLVLEPDTPVQSGIGTSFTLSPPIRADIKFTTGSDEEEEEGLRDEGEVDGEGGGGRGGESLPEEITGEVCGADHWGQQGGVEEGTDGARGEGGQDRETSVKMEESEQAGSIMQSQEALAGDVEIDLLLDPLSDTPTSPLLPTTMETVALEMQEEQVIQEQSEEMKQPLQLIDSGSGNPLPISESPLTTCEEGILIDISSSGVTPPLSAGHQLEVTECQQSTDSTAHKLDVQETGILPPFDPLSGVPDTHLPGTVATHLSDPLLPSHLPLVSQLQVVEDDLAEELKTMGTRGDMGADPAALPPRRPSPFPEVVEGVREALYTAWIPSPWTQGLLSQPASVTQQHLTCPGLVADIKMHDPISELLSTHFPSATRKALPSVESVSMDMAGLRRLVKERCYHAALELTGRFLSAHGQGLGQAGQPSLHTHRTMQMWAARLSLLVAMQQYREAEIELNAFGELVNPDLYYQYHTHNYPGKTGSMVPFSMRLIHAQLPSQTGNHQQSLDRLCLLQHTCQEILAEVRRGFLPFISEPLTLEDQQVAVSLWLERLTRVKFSLANTLVAMQDYLLAIQVYESLLEQLPVVQGQLQSVIGRLYLSLGDLPSAQTYFSQVASGGEEEGEVEGRDRAVMAHINQGLVNVFHCRWQLAKDSFESALQLDPGNLLLRNNTAVCTFYQGHLKECISEMESVVRLSPPRSLQPALFCNLTAAYDLESSSAQSKKLSFLPLLGQHVGEGFPLSSLSVR